MTYRGSKARKGKKLGTYIGKAKTFHDAIEVAVDFARRPDGTKFVVGQILVTSKGDPNVGGYTVTITETPPPS